MKSKADVKNFIKVAEDLEEAIARADVSERELRILSWFKLYTYGRRQAVGKGSEKKWIAADAITISHNYISEDLGIHRSRVKGAIENLVKLRVLRCKAGDAIGINSQLDQWACSFRGRSFAFRPNRGQSVLGQSGLGQIDPKMGRFGPKLGRNGPKMGRNVPGVSYARAESSRDKRGGEGTTPPISNQVRPSGTPLDWAELGDPNWPPGKHPGYGSLAFVFQKQYDDHWEYVVKSKEAAASNRRYQERTTKEWEEAEKNKLTPEQAKEILSKAIKGGKWR